MGLFSTLNTGYSGLSASEVAMDVTGHNIANANNDYYTRQRVVTQAATPLYDSTPGSVGQGVTVTSISRIHDEYVYGRLKDSSNSLSYDQYNQDKLNEVAKYFPDLQDLGIESDLKNYFASWNDFASNANEGSQKVALVQSASTLTSNINDSRDKLRNLQDDINNELKSNIDELNQIGEQIANLNKDINRIESVDPNRANDLRDQRDKLELTLSEMVDFSVFKGDITSVNTIDSNMTDQGIAYHLNIAGGSFVDGSTFHPIKIENVNNESNYYSVYTEMQDGKQYDLTEKLSGGKIGAMLDLRGRKFDAASNDGYPTDGIIQGYIDDLDTFANTLITQTNNIYAKSASDKMVSPVNRDLEGDMDLVNSSLHVEEGSFDLVMYDSNGVEVGRKTIDINGATTMSDDTFQPSIITQINSSTDDNSDNNSINDIDDYFYATYQDNGIFSIMPKDPNSGYTISFEDHGTNFPGAIGINQFFQGDDASNIAVKEDFIRDPSALQGYKAPVEGNNDVANDMVQLQYDDLNFYSKDGVVTQETLEGYYRYLTTEIATDAEQAGREVDTSQALFNTVNEEFQSISGVNTDEELTNLIKFQASYGANAKVISTIDEMLNTLLGIKQ